MPCYEQRASAEARNEGDERDPTPSRRRGFGLTVTVLAQDLGQRMTTKSPVTQQGRQDSNLQPPVLETGALPIELRPWADGIVPLVFGHSLA